MIKFFNEFDIPKSDTTNASDLMIVTSISATPRITLTTQ